MNNFDTKQIMNDYNNMSVLNLDQENITDPNEMSSHFEELSQFYKQFSHNIVVYDPLDRPIPDEDNDEAIKRDDFIKKLDEMPGIYGFALNAPMNKEKSQLLERMFESEIQACNQIG